MTCLDNSPRCHSSSPGQREFVQVALKLEQKKSVTDPQNRDTREVACDTTTRGLRL